MIRVALDTSTSLGTVAVGRGDRVLAEVGVGVQSRHSETILPALETALGLAGVGREAVEEVVVGAGPGSFTGVRVAGATAKGLSAALGVPLVAWSSLLAMAAAVAADRAVCALMDARRGEVYGGCWRFVEAGEDPPDLQTLLEPMVGPVEEVVGAVRSHQPLFAGAGAVRYRSQLASSGADLAMAPIRPRASLLLWLAHQFPGQGRVAEVAGWEPSYVRGSSAERGVRG